MQRFVLIALFFFTFAAGRAKAQEYAVIPFKAFEDQPTTPVLVLTFKPGEADSISEVTPDNILLQIERARGLHEEAAAGFIDVMKALKEKDPALFPMEAMGPGMGGGGMGQGGQQQREAMQQRPLKRYRLARAGKPELRARVNNDGIVEQIVIIPNINTYDIRRQYYFRCEGKTCRLLSMNAQSADGFFRYWFLRPDQTLIGTVRCEASGTLDGPLLEWDETGKLTQALSIKSGNYFFDNPFQR